MSADAEKITVTDQRGVTLEFDGPVERVVTIPMPAASMFVAVDGGVDHLVGMNPASLDAITEGVLGEFYPEAADIPADVAGTDFVPNVESILAADPDVVIQWGDRSEQITGPLEDAGIPVIGLSYGSQEDLETWIEIFGAILGKDDRAEEIIQKHQDDLDMIGNAVAQEEESPSILYLNQSSGGYIASGTESYMDFSIDLVGAENAAAELTGSAEEVGIEQILDRDPEIVLLSNFDTTMPEDIYADELWQDVSAVRDKRVYRVPLGGYRWDPPNQESNLMWHWLAQIAHPDADLDPLRPRIESSAEYLYGQVPTAEQVDEILWSSENADSQGYDAFTE
ncbi:MAG: ABC transporter substrate-binding protein [Nocardiopsaceae bacterium]|nr:ABC transporter substrate-binding protein [Nocardiopsaceae bacterium]